MTSFSFVFFVPVLLAVYYLIPRRLQWGLLLLVSLGFYAAGGARYLGFLLFTAVSVYGSACLMDARQREEGGPGNRGILVLCLTANFLILGLCKISLVVPGLMGLGLPLGISFYMFQATGYLIDVYRGKAKAEKNFLKFLLFVSYFPQVVQGPISKFGFLSRTLYGEHVCNVKEISFGVQRMLLGYFKKLVIADRIAVAVAALRGPEYLGVGFFLLTFFYAIQIYCDFTGGMDIALGLSQALGVTLPENFIRPYFSKNTAEYWRRWHITLGQWMKDYIFYPLSVSRPLMKLGRWARKRWKKFGKRLPVYVAAVVTWAVTGIWHGITPNFLVWGMLNCGVIIASQELEPVYARFHQRYHLKEKFWYGGFEVLRMFFLMNLIRACDLFPHVGEYFRRMGSLIWCPSFHLLTDGSLMGLGLSGLDYTIILVGMVILFLVSWGEAERGSIREVLYGKSVVWQYLVFFGLFLIVLLMGHYGVGYEASAFIYNQF